MIKTKNLLASLSLEIPALEVDQEGKLRGGFNAFSAASVASEAYNQNCNCNCGCDYNDNCNCNCSCNGNGNCNCNCGCTVNSNCNTCAPTGTPGPTEPPQSAGVASATVVFGASTLL